MAFLTAAQHARTLSSNGAYFWFARPWSSLMTSMPPLAKWYAISASFATHVPIGFSAVIRSGPFMTPNTSLKPAVPNRGPRNLPSNALDKTKSSTITFSLIEVLPKITFRSCGSSLPEVSSLYRTTASHRVSPGSEGFTGWCNLRRKLSHFATTCSLIQVPGGTRAKGSSTVCSKQRASTISLAPASSGAETTYVTRK